MALEPGYGYVIYHCGFCGRLGAKVGSEWYYYQEDGTVAKIPGSTLWSATMNPANLPIR